MVHNMKGFKNEKLSHGHYRCFIVYLCPDYVAFNCNGDFMITREQLVSDYLDWVNNYLTVDKFAEHRGLTKGEAHLLLTLGQFCNEHKHPEA